MPAYRCDLLTADGSRASRLVEAASAEEAEATVRAAGGTPLAIAGPTPSLAARVAALRPRPRPIVTLDPPGPSGDPPEPAGDPRGASGRAGLIVAALLLSIPLTTGLLATALTIRETAASERLRRAAAPALARITAVRAAAAARPGVAAALGGRTLSDLLGRVAAALPAGATLASAASSDGTVRLEVETDDPEALRAALAGDPLLGRLRTTGETAVPDRGVRVQLAGTLP